MEVSHSLLVTIMFTVILSMGIGNIITTLASVVNRRSTFKADGLHTTWMILMLLIHLNLFWHALSILEVEEWVFLEFLLIIAGPILAFFATSVLLPDVADAELEDIRAHYFNCAGQFFLLLGILQIWIIYTDFFLGHGFGLPSVFNLLVGVLAFTLALVRTPRVHTFGAVAGWFLVVIIEVLRVARVMT